MADTVLNILLPKTCYIKLGEFYWRCGDGPAAIRNFVRTRDYCTTNQHTTEMCFKTIKASVYNIKSET